MRELEATFQILLRAPANDLWDACEKLRIKRTLAGVDHGDSDDEPMASINWRLPVEKGQPSLERFLALALEVLPRAGAYGGGLHFSITDKAHIVRAGATPPVDYPGPPWPGSVELCLHEDRFAVEMKRRIGRAIEMLLAGKEGEE